MSARKPMLVEGYTVPTEIEDHAVAWIRGSTDFAAADVIRLLLFAGVPHASVNGGRWGPAHRIADRILQRERRAGTIRFAKGKWHRPSPPLADLHGVQA